MFRTKLSLIRGGYFVTSSYSALMSADGLTRQICITTEKEFYFDSECNEDLAVIERITIYFRPTKAGWKKAYHRLRCEFGTSMRQNDAMQALNLQQRLSINKKRSKACV